MYTTTDELRNNEHNNYSLNKTHCMFQLRTDNRVERILQLGYNTLTQVIVYEDKALD